MSVQRSHTTLAIGLTGGIGSGKTAVSNLFQQLGANVIDADEIARALVSKGTPLLEDIRQHFGDDILDPEGNLNRRALRETVFNDTTARQWLESLLHPAVRQTIMEQLQHSTAPYTLVVIPLLVESGSYPFLDRIAVVDIPESLRLSARYRGITARLNWLKRFWPARHHGKHAWHRQMMSSITAALLTLLCDR